MDKLNFSSALQLRDFYLEQGFFALYDCVIEESEPPIEHYSLLRSGDGISPQCFAHDVINLNSEVALVILEKFLKTGLVKIHPSAFLISQ